MAVTVAVKREYEIYGADNEGQAYDLNNKGVTVTNNGYFKRKNQNDCFGKWFQTERTAKW